MFLTPEETRLFPRDHIFPLYGAGLKGRARPRPAYIFAYQMDLEPCPFFDQQTHLCTNYDRRPVTCRSFPLVGSAAIASQDCQFLARFNVKEETFVINEETIREEREANRKGMLHVATHLQRQNLLWVWPLDLKRWIKKTKQDILNDLDTIGVKR